MKYIIDEDNNTVKYMLPIINEYQEFKIGCIPYKKINILYVGDNIVHTILIEIVNRFIIKTLRVVKLDYELDGYTIKIITTKYDNSNYEQSDIFMTKVDNNIIDYTTEEYVITLEDIDERYKLFG